MVTLFGLSMLSVYVAKLDHFSRLLLNSKEKQKVAGKMVQLFEIRSVKLCQSGSFSFRVFDRPLLTLDLQSTFLSLDLWADRLWMVHFERSRSAMIAHRSLCMLKLHFRRTLFMWCQPLIHYFTYFLMTMNGTNHMEGIVLQKKNDMFTF